MSDSSKVALSIRNFIDSLKETKPYTIKVYSRGCFHQTFHTLKVVKTKTGFAASLQEQGSISGEGTYQFKHSYKPVSLTQEQIECLREFEQKLQMRSGQDGVCTTHNEFSLKVNETTYRFDITDCEWNGHNSLFNSLFVSRKKDL